MLLQKNSIGKSFRHSCHKMGIPILLFEGGKSFHLDTSITNTGVNGIKRVLHHMGMLRSKFKVSQPKKPCVKIKGSKWIRASHSGMFKPKVSVHTKVLKGEALGHITDPYGNSNFVIQF